MNHFESHNLFENLLTSISEPFFVIDEDGTCLDICIGFTDATVLPAETLKGKRIHDVLEPEIADFFMTQIQKTLKHGIGKCFEYEFPVVEHTMKANSADSQWYDVRMYPLVLSSTEKKAVTVLMINISERKNLQQRLREFSFHDVLTRAYNRAYFLERLSEQLELFTQQKIPVSIMIIDIDNFRTVNNTFGYYVGDHFLQDFVDLLLTHMSEDDMCARLGSDEFVISMKGETIERALVRAETIRNSIQNFVGMYAQRAITVTASVGVSTMIPFDTDAANILSRAGKALIQAKSHGKNRVEQE